MKISVIIPSYKPQSYLWECLDSLRKQTFPFENFEIILVLNGCKEPYENQILDYLTKYPDLQVNFVQIDQGGVSNARNIALDMAKGEYVTFIDDDDYVSPSYLEELYENVSLDTISLCYPYAFNDGNSNVQLSYCLTDIYEYCHLQSSDLRLSSKVRKYFSGPWMKLIPMSFIQDRRFDVRFKNGEDSLFMFLISDRFRRFSITSPNAIYYRRYRSGSAVTTRRSLCMILGNNLRLSMAYSRIYFGNIFQYDLRFYLTRLLGQFRTLVVNI